MTVTDLSATQAVQFEDNRTGRSVETIKRAFADNLFYVQGKIPATASQNDYYMALAYTVRDRLLQRWLATAETCMQPQVKVVAYLSAEFLEGPHLGNNLINLGIYDEVKQAMTESGLDLDVLLEQEEEPGLGNGGLGRLVACYMDSLATQEIPAIGYGIRYDFGIFEQEICDGWQVEITNKWLKFGNPWEISRPEESVLIGFGGHTDTFTDSEERYHIRWVPHKVVKGIPYDTPILGYRVNTANTLRLWKAEAPESFEFDAFNVGNYYDAVNQKVVSESLTKVLYPDDEPIQGKQLRLEQQYFFVSCALQDMIRIHLATGKRLECFSEKFAVQLNGTHPSIGIAELMRLLVDEHHLDWNKAWDITQKTFAYTSHTLLPEALEKWSLSLFESLLPRHLEIIYEINQRFLDVLRLKYFNDGKKLSQLSLIDESGEKFVRMAHLACVGSHTVNGVAALQSNLLKQTVLQDFHELWPEKLTHVTNGVTPRRWMALSNPQLTDLISQKIGDRWITHLQDLKQLEPLAEDPTFRAAWQQVKRLKKQALAQRILDRTGITVNPDSMFDIQVKRIRECNRQHLNVLHIITLYNRLKQNSDLDLPERTFIFAGKAAPDNFLAKLIIKLITSVGDVVNNDPDIQDRIKVVFLPDFNVTNSQPVYPAADLSEQISTAGKEASGTGNMKLSLNGALTIGTLGGANVEIREAVGVENFFLFGLAVDEVVQIEAQGYSPREYCEHNPDLLLAMHRIESGFFSHGDRNLFRPLVDALLCHDPYLLCADYQSYIECQEQVSQAYLDPDHWVRMSILNTARVGYFSSDRSIREYAENIWHVPSIPIEMNYYTQDDTALFN
ncbi:glycogen/starch/alpha-glucan phosphorylase [Acaryochloris sp. CCMEE 5410]|uniref:glycogen/starch/alpha-glucan phosphorylase n=1 Tax=Acaryochloris sp. CCMEE 5410 TaxID=310037 RepID=UPI00024843DF|nr:glycogen/starch/alpha-glucan phosphorylase [Acaryochloris sp. CCMEE 5410]KAI9129932.1 glycogen/starch/alpha-glucan phosphorylase [Acaryochloris sp. CCMEE 5410]